MNLDDITPLVLTFNEEANIERTLSALRWAKRVVVLDSGSNDATHEIAMRFGNVDWRHRAFDDHAGQCNYALSALLADAAWVLSMDADYLVPLDFVAELAALPVDESLSGLRARFVYCVNGRALHGGLYPPRVVVYRPERAYYAQEGHAHVLRIEGPVQDLRSPLRHDDRKPVANFVRNQRRYAALEARWLWSQSWSALRWSDRARRLLLVAPWLAPLLVLLVRGGWRDGVEGLRYAGERGFAETMVSWELCKRMLFRSIDK